MFNQRKMNSVVFLVILVALSAIALGITKMVTAWDSTRAQRLVQADIAAAQLAASESMIGPQVPEPVRVFYVKKVQYHRSMEEKYRQAASRPWESVSPDPPPPAMPTVGELMQWAAAKASSEEI